ncbi:MAG: tRNA 2-thiouridine(34) synthase MnmA [Flavobacteriales bacterium]|nr:tRNA 2-thiouridine(34) synthase MnmA [Flavobacteriales bacterium]|tara:strand:+ start:1494 stop:2684 length:1191 start_codon:yes stop_codon:yes gene_type:complete
MKRVVVGLSGGVDSSVAAYLLKKEGFEVIGLFMKNWHDTSVTISKECPWVEDSNDAMSVAETLEIPFQTIDLSKDYKERIVDYMFKEYKRGRTPNPDILCNREIKFDIFLKAALKLNADFVATGHYCRKDIVKINGSSTYQLKAGIDKNKDQSYFLCQLNQEQLSKALFPIGTLEKSEVRKIAQEAGLVTAEKKDSQGLCFIGKVKLPDFLQQQLKPKKGAVIEIRNDHPLFIKKALNIDDSLLETLNTISRKYEYSPEMGTEVGIHNGAHYFTIGQRKGINIGGKLEPLFVIDTDTVSNTIYVGQGTNHPGLFRLGLKVLNTDVHWVRNDLKLENGCSLKVLSRIRYRQKLEKAEIHQRKDGLFVVFEKEQRGIAAGQFIAWYVEDELLGSGVIS